MQYMFVSGWKGVFYLFLLPKDQILKQLSYDFATHYYAMHQHLSRAVCNFNDRMRKEKME